MKTKNLLGKQLAGLLGVRPTSLSSAARKDHLCQGYPVAKWARRDERGTVTGYHVPAEIHRSLSAPSGEPDEVNEAVETPSEGAGEPHEADDLINRAVREYSEGVALEAHEAGDDTAVKEPIAAGLTDEQKAAKIFEMDPDLRCAFKFIDQLQQLDEADRVVLNNLLGFLNDSEEISEEDWKELEKRNDRGDFEGYKLRHYKDSGKVELVAPADGQPPQ